MHCQEIQNLWGLYHDHELDQSQMQLIRNHLQGCTACDQSFRSQDHFHLTLTSALRQGACSDALWSPKEAAIRRAFQPAESARDTIRAPRESITDRVVALAMALLWPSPKYYAALASVWIILLAVNFSLTEGTAKPVAAAQGRESVSRTRSSLTEYRRELLLELATKESTENKPAREQSPRSELRHPSTMEPSAQNDALPGQKGGINAALCKAEALSMNLSKVRQVLDCGSPLPLWVSSGRCQSARGLAQSKTLSRERQSRGSWSQCLAKWPWQVSIIHECVYRNNQLKNTPPQFYEYPS